MVDMLAILLKSLWVKIYKRMPQPPDWGNTAKEVLT